jgi:hypothetical protein
MGSKVFGVKLDWGRNATRSEAARQAHWIHDAIMGSIPFLIPNTYYQYHYRYTRRCSGFERRLHVIIVLNDN